MKIFRKIFRSEKKKHVVNQKKRRATSKARNASRTRDAHLLKDDFLFGTGTSRSKPHRRKHKVCTKTRRPSLGVSTFVAPAVSAVNDVYLVLILRTSSDERRRMQ